MSKVFISYSHDTAAHSDRVLAFAQALRCNGIDVELDQFHTHEIVDWPRWCNEQISRSYTDFVLCICTSEYNRRIEGKVPPEKGKGVYWEGSLIDDDLYDEKGNHRFIPILLDGESEDTIPRFLRGWTFCRLSDFTLLDQGYEQVIRILTNQASVIKNPLGTIPVLSHKSIPIARQVRFVSHPQISPTRLTHGADRLFGRDEELEDLDKAWDDPKTHILTIVAFGGVGKTSLVVEWMNHRAAAGWPGMDRVFDWSFYSQGAREEGAASADIFIKAALTFFGDKEMADSAASAWDKGARLSELVAEKATLLVLDGLEPLQYPPGPIAGKLKDPSIEMLLKGLARRNPGLCLVTTRESVANLRPFRNTTAPERKLHQLSTPAGAELLKSLGVTGTEPEIKQLIENVKGHALTLSLLGRFLTEAYQGDIRMCDKVKFQEADEEIQGGHAFRVMESYEKWFAEEGKDGRRLIAALSLLGLFDRPADARCINALRKPPTIRGVTEPLVDQGNAKWNLTLKRLEACGLVSLCENKTESAYTVDTHPLIREYFAKQLREKKPEAWRAAHKRLYEHLTKDTKDKTQPTLEDLLPLYQAVTHGCLAGMQGKTCEEVFIRRIQRDQEGYSTYKLCALGADLGAVACFFEQRWSRVSPSLSESNQAWLLHEASYNLYALGRLAEALEPRYASLEILMRGGAWKKAAICAMNLSNLELTLGKVNSAITSAEQSIMFADRSGSVFMKEVAFATLADSLNQSGNLDEALQRFRQAEAMKAERTARCKYLDDLRGFQYCELLLTKVEQTCWKSYFQEAEGASPDYITLSAEVGTLFDAIGDVEHRGKTMIECQNPNESLLGISLERLPLCRAVLFRAILTDSHSEKTAALLIARKEIGFAVDGLRRAGQQQYIPFVLLSRAWLRSVDGDEPGAKADLDEAWEMAERGPMCLHMADILLYRARLFREGKALKQARALIEQCGYWRRKEELEDAELAAKNW